MQQESFPEARVESKLFVLSGTENYNPETATIFFFANVLEHVFD
jgi:hypothetical protein